jgi:hypothetical protein
MNNLEQGINAFKNGNRDIARNYFIAAIKENPQDEQAWGWMYQAANNDKERFDCLNHIVKINPQNTRAKQLLDQLLAPPANPLQSAPKQQYSAPPTSPKKNNSWIIIAVVSALVIVICICVVASFSSGSILSPQAKYIVNGTASSALVSYFNEQGGMEQANVQLPFEKDLSVKTGVPLSLVAQNQGSGSITCEIWINGQKTKTSTSTAEFGVVTCTDFVP